MTGTERIRWEATGHGGWTGHVGALADWLFQIWSAAAMGGDWQLDSNLPGGWRHIGTRSGDPEKLKAEAEERLAEFVTSLGALFPEPAHPAERPGKRKLGDAGILDAFRTVTNWSDAEVLHYESCDWCDPFASVVCEASPPALKLAERDQEAAVKAAGERG